MSCARKAHLDLFLILPKVPTGEMLYLDSIRYQSDPCIIVLSVCFSCSFWQRLSDAGANSGWGGRIIDRVVSAEDVSPFSSMSIFGNTTMMTGETTVATNVTPTGRSLLRARATDLFGSAQISAATEQLMSKNYNNLFCGVSRIHSKAIT